MIDLTVEQVAGLAEIDAKGFVRGVCGDLIKENPKLSGDPTLEARLWRAYKAARGFGIEEDDNLVAFLRVETYAPNFYEEPATRAWLTRPGRSADVRFHDYLRVMRWRIEHPEFVGGMTYGEPIGAVSGVGSGGTWASLGSWWRGVIGRSSNGRNG